MKKEILRTEEAITLVKETFAGELARQLSLVKVSSPIAVLDGTGINDDLNGVERPVSFPVKALNDKRAVVVHSLAKWKRLRLKQLDMEPNRGILTDMRALRPDEDFTALHSIYVDQWDWEQRILIGERTLGFLKETVKKIYSALKFTEQVVYENYPNIEPVLPEEITFVHSEELLRSYPSLTAKERESAAVREYGAIFIIGIGGELSNGEPHEGRAPDYDDWSTPNEDGYFGLNGDIIVWHPVLQCAFELSSMGIRVDREVLVRQLVERGCAGMSLLPFHSMLLAGELPESIGGGIGQSRVCMFMLKKRHIGEVQVSIWPEMEKLKLAAAGVTLL
ncbi:MAG: aspartate--ammonia ligase [Bacteroidales bacterium]